MYFCSFGNFTNHIRSDSDPFGIDVTEDPKMNSDAEKLLIITHGWMDSAKMNSDWLKDAVQNVRLLNLQGFVLNCLLEINFEDTTRSRQKATLRLARIF